MEEKVLTHINDQGRAKMVDVGEKEKTKRMYLAGYYPTSSPEDVIENTGFDIDVSRAVLLNACPGSISSFSACIPLGTSV